MSTNNKVTLVGNIGGEPKVIEHEGKLFASFSMATTDTYLDKNDNTYKKKNAVWHKVLAFSPSLIELVKTFNKGTRVEVNGSLAYRSFDIQRDNKPPARKMEASIIAQSMEVKP